MTRRIPLFPLCSSMAAANASARGQRVAILGSQLHELTGFLIAVDCGTQNCRGERAYAMAELAGMFGREVMVSDVLHRMRCAECGAAVVARGFRPARCSTSGSARVGWR